MVQWAQINKETCLMPLKSAPAVSPLLETRVASSCGWLRSVRPAPVAPYRRPHKRMLSRRPYAVFGKVDTVAKEAAWSFFSYADLLEGLPRYS